MLYLAPLAGDISAVDQRVAVSVQSPLPPNPGHTREDVVIVEPREDQLCFDDILLPCERQHGVYAISQGNNCILYVRTELDLVWFTLGDEQ